MASEKPVVSVQDNEDNDRCVWNIVGKMNDRERARHLKKNVHKKFPEIEPQPA
jgi:hypothetical protein